VYLLIFSTLGLLTSTLTSRPATALILVLFIWTVWVLGVPRIGRSVAKGLRPVQPNFTFGLAKRAVRQGSFEDYREILWKMDDEYIAMVDAQMEMGQSLSRFSPFASYVYASSTLAQTGISDAQNFRQQVAHWDRERRRGRITELALPPIRLEQSFPEIATDLILLLLWNVLLFMGANVAFLRYDVR
jgi:ABC-type transport system involved in multi-copper enzyme maturation permease subunit